MHASKPAVRMRAGDWEAGRTVGFIDIVSGSFGTGHDRAAAEIERRLHDVGVDTRRWDVVDLMPGALGPALRAAYLRQMKSLPSSWGWLLGRLERHTGMAHMAASLAGAAAPRIERLTRDGSTLGFVATHPFASQALGALRSRGRLPVPAITYLTDMSVHPLWVHPGVDLHLAVHVLPAAAARRIGAREVTVVRPAVPERFGAATPSSRHPSMVRSALGLPAQARLALLTGGAQGIGDLERAADEVAATGVAIPVVLCGRNERLRARLQRRDGVLALGWVDDVAELLAAVDVVIQNAGGITSLESLASGVPVVSYRCIPGHGEANAAALDSAGLVPWLRGTVQLRAGLIQALATKPEHPAAPASPPHPDVATAILELMVPTHATPVLVPR